MTMAGTETTQALSLQVAEEIRVMMARRQIRQSQLARRLDVNDTWLSVRLRGIQAIDLNDLQRIADALDVAIVELLPSSAKRTGDKKTTEWYDPLTERRSERARRPPDNRPSGKPRAGNASGIPRTTYLRRTDARKAA